MNRFGILASLCSCVIVVGIFALPPSTRQTFASDDDSQIERQILSVIEHQQSAWNAGDIPQFMETYWNSQQLTFCSGGDIQRGWQATFDRYTARYPDRKIMGQLTFTDLECELMGADFAKVIGVWKLDRDQPASGRFTLILKKFDDQWLIIHDHTSVQS